MSDQQATVSLIVIAKYGTNGYRRLIDSAAPHVDEVVTVLDANPEDGIEGYCSDLVRYFHRTMNKDFGGQYNFGVQSATSDWVLQLDTDENLTPWLWSHIRFLADATPEDGVAFPFHNHIIGMKDYLAWPDYHTRLYRRLPAMVWQGQVHPILQGVESTRILPAEDRFAVQHIKTLAMQARSEQHYA
jgi:glycosyltransferase involved in cell wall biosynthesis